MNKNTKTSINATKYVLENYKKKKKKELKLYKIKVK